MNDIVWVENETRKHIIEVQKNLGKIAKNVMDRQALHDASKLVSPEAEIFAKYTERLSNMVYASDEYKQCLAEMNLHLNHYETNPHHPEHYKDGIKGMSLVDIIEMLCDWTAATKRYKNGDILKSIEINQERFGYTDELKQILINTLKEIQ